MSYDEEREDSSGRLYIRTACTIQFWSAMGNCAMFEFSISASGGVDDNILVDVSSIDVRASCKISGGSTISICAISDVSSSDVLSDAFRDKSGAMNLKLEQCCFELHTHYIRAHHLWNHLLALIEPHYELQDFFDTVKEMEECQV